MGVSCKVTFPAKTEVDDVLFALAVLTGRATPALVKIGRNTTAAMLTVDGVEVDTSKVIDVRTTIYNLATVDVRISHTSYSPAYDFEGPKGQRQLRWGCNTPDRIAISRALVDCFGGSVDVNDCDDIDVDYHRPAWRDADAEDGAAWDRRQTRLANLRAIPNLPK